MSALRPFFSYYGSKWSLAGRYPEPQHATLYEPFAGSAGYSLHYPHLRVVLCDISPFVCAVWRYLIGASEQEILSLPDVPINGSVDDLEVAQEAKWLIGYWLNRATHTPRSRPSKWMREWGTRKPLSSWSAEQRARIASQLQYIRHWQIVEGSYSALPNELATWHIDPPYLVAGVHYWRYGSTKIDFDALAAWCRSRLGQVIVCENEGAKWLPFAPLASVRTQRHGGRSSEVIWCSQ